MDVAVGRLAEVGGVDLLAEPVPVAREDAPRPRPLEGEAEPANAAEEVNEAERRALLGVRRVRPSGARRSDAVGRCFLPQRRRGCGRAGAENWTCSLAWASGSLRATVAAEFCRSKLAVLRLAFPRLSSRRACSARQQRSGSSRLRIFAAWRRTRHLTIGAIARSLCAAPHSACGHILPIAEKEFPRSRRRGGNPVAALRLRCPL